MAFESLFSKPPNPVLDPNMPDSDRQHAGDERSSNILLSLRFSCGGDTSGVMVVMMMVMVMMMMMLC